MVEKLDQWAYLVLEWTEEEVKAFYQPNGQGHEPKCPNLLALLWVSLTGLGITCMVAAVIMMIYAAINVAFVGIKGV